MTFDGPGQNAALVRQGLAFRPDWEKVITPVADSLSARADVDGAKLALPGVSQAGYWVPRVASGRSQTIDDAFDQAWQTLGGQAPEDTW